MIPSVVMYMAAVFSVVLVVGRACCAFSGSRDTPAIVVIITPLVLLIVVILFAYVDATQCKAQVIENAEETERLPVSDISFPEETSGDPYLVKLGNGQELEVPRSQMLLECDGEGAGCTMLSVREYNDGNGMYTGTVYALLIPTSGGAAHE